jgi:hypothetical protein
MVDSNGRANEEEENRETTSPGSANFKPPPETAAVLFTNIVAKDNSNQVNAGTVNGGITVNVNNHGSDTAERRHTETESVSDVSLLVFRGSIRGMFSLRQQALLVRLGFATVN